MIYKKLNEINQNAGRKPTLKKSDLIFSGESQGWARGSIKERESNINGMFYYW